MGRDTARKISTAKDIANTACGIVRREERSRAFQQMTDLQEENRMLVRSLKKMLGIVLEQKGLKRLAESEIAETERAKVLVAKAEGVEVWP